MADLLTHLSDEELLSRAYANQDPLTSTPLEGALAKRFANALDELREIAPLLDVLGEYDVANPVSLRALLDQLPEGDIAQATALLTAINEAERTDPAELKTALQFLAKFEALTDDPDAALAALEALFNTATA